MRKALASAVNSLPSSVSDAEVPDVNGLALKAMSLGKDLFKKGLDPHSPPPRPGAAHTQAGRWGKTKSPQPHETTRPARESSSSSAAPRPRRRVSCHTPASSVSHPFPFPLIPFDPPLRKDIQRLIPRSHRIPHSKSVVLNLSEMEAKVRDATSAEKWGPSGTILNEISMATTDEQNLEIILNVRALPLSTAPLSLHWTGSEAGDGHCCSDSSGVRRVLSLSLQAASPWSRFQATFASRTPPSLHPPLRRVVGEAAGQSVFVCV
jgi:hypothetical protein